MTWFLETKFLSVGRNGAKNIDWNCAGSALAAITSGENQNSWNSSFGMFASNKTSQPIASTQYMRVTHSVRIFNDSQILQKSVTENLPLEPSKAPSLQGPE